MNSFRHKRRTRQQIGLFCLGLFATESFTTTSCFLSPHRSQQWRPPTLHSRICTSLSSTTQNTHGVELQTKLEEMTVKELKLILKNSSLNQRGILSRLKLKKDLVVYLAENLDPSELNGIEEPPSSTLIVNGHTEDNATPEKPSTIPPTESTSPPTLQKMPQPLMNMAPAPTVQLSPKDIIFEKIYEQYPPVRDQNCTEVGELDVRQTHHPIFSEPNMKHSSDMDIVFVGTASCTPGITRGVSCTALRLNWKRRPSRGIPNAPQALDSSFDGGTWLFDVGECTQVGSESNTHKQ